MFEQWGLSIQDFERLLSAGRILFLFDGLDEVPEAKRLSIQFMLQEILSIHSECRLICSSRLCGCFSIAGCTKGRHFPILFSQADSPFCQALVRFP